MTDLAAFKGAQGGRIDRGQDMEGRAGQMNLVGQLQEQAAGRGPSLASAQLKEATDRNIAQQIAAQASTRGASNPALAQRAIASRGTEMAQDAGRQAAMLRTQEQLAAREQLAGALQSTRAQDLDVAGRAAQLAQQSNQFNAEQLNQYNMNQAQLDNAIKTANLQGYIQQQGQKDAMYQALLDQRLGIDSSQFQANQSLEALQAQNAANYNNAVAGAYENAAGRRAGAFGGAAGALAGIFALSDEEQKKNISSGSGTVNSFLDSLNLPETSKPKTITEDVASKSWEQYRKEEKTKTDEEEEKGKKFRALLASQQSSSGGNSGYAAGEKMGKGLGSLIGGLAMMSDKRQKTNIKPAHEDIKKLFSGVSLMRKR